MAITFNRGDIVRVNLNPPVGKEKQGEFRPCLVMSPEGFNKLGSALVAPITQGGNFARYGGFAVSLTGAGLETQGVILLNGVRMVDLQALQAVKVESAPSYIVDEASAIFSALLTGKA